jgi:hypothetical protein
MRPVKSPGEPAQAAGDMQEADRRAARARERRIGKRALWLWLATLGMFAIALVIDYSREQPEPARIAFLSSTR